jgi:putative tRNA adenosine deaminase-associated protein
VAYSALAFARAGAEAWTGKDLDLDDVEDLEGAIEMLQDLFETAETVVVFVEENDEWVGIVRTEADPGDDDDVRVFVSDHRVLESSPLAHRLFEEASVVVETDEVDDEEAESEGSSPDGGTPDITPAGDLKLLTDLGTDAAALLALCAAEGALPGDVIAALVESVGAGEVYERLRPT